jgi:hypothetical protein
MSLSLADTQAIAELADALYSFLPGSGAVYTWREASQQSGVGEYWVGGSKLPAITDLLEAAYTVRRERFCDLILTAVRQGMKYRIKKQEPVHRAEIDRINSLLLKLRFKIPELHDPGFLNGLPGSITDFAAPKSGACDGVGVMPPPQVIRRLHQSFSALFAETDAVRRGYKFEQFLNEFFDTHDLAPRGSFKLMGEQIDGSFEMQGSVFLVEARWRQTMTTAADLFVLRGKAEKSEWTRGLFISVNGFSDLASETLRMNRKANLVCMCGQDLVLILEGRWVLQDALRAKLRHTGETGDAYIPLGKLVCR